MDTETFDTITRTAAVTAPAYNREDFTPATSVAGVIQAIDLVTETVTAVFETIPRDAKVKRWMHRSG